MASSSHYRDDGDTTFSSRARLDNSKHGPFDDDGDHADFLGDDADSDEDTLDDTPPALEPYYPGVTMCIVSLSMWLVRPLMYLTVCFFQVCQKRRPYSKNGKSYPTCGMTCARILQDANGTTSKSGPRSPQSSQIEESDGTREALCIVCPIRIFSDFVQT